MWPHCNILITRDTAAGGILTIIKELWPHRNVVVTVTYAGFDDGCSGKDHVWDGDLWIAAQAAFLDSSKNAGAVDCDTDSFGNGGFFITQGDIVIVANLTNLTVFVTFLVVNAALIRLRYTRPDQDRPFRSPLSIGRLPILPVAGIVSCCMMISQITYDILLMGAVLIAIGWLVSRVR